MFLELKRRKRSREGPSCKWRKESRGRSARTSSSTSLPRPDASPCRRDRSPPFPRSPGPPWPRSPSLPCLCSRGAAEESTYAVPRLDSTPASPWRARRRRPKLAQLAAPRHAALGRDLLERARTPLDLTAPRLVHHCLGFERSSRRRAADVLAPRPPYAASYAI